MADGVGVIVYNIYINGVTRRNLVSVSKKQSSK